MKQLLTSGSNNLSHEITMLLQTLRQKYGHSIQGSPCSIRAWFYYCSKFKFTSDLKMQLRCPGLMPFSFIMKFHPNSEG